MQRITLKAFANFSPGLRFETLGSKDPQETFPTLKELRVLSGEEMATQLFRVASSRSKWIFPRVAKAQPWAEISERLQRYSAS